MKGKQPENLRTGWIDCAQRMGYYCAENNETNLPFDGLIYREAVMVAVKLKKSPVHSPGEDFFIDKKFPNEVSALRTLPPTRDGGKPHKREPAPHPPDLSYTHLGPN